jgi:hypothetical protein
LGKYGPQIHTDENDREDEREGGETNRGHAKNAKVDETTGREK